MFNSHDAGPSALRASKVSPKEDAFCLAIVAGANASDAYRTAYRPQRAKPKTIHEKASRLMAKGKVQARVDELMAPVIAEAQMTRTEWLQWLTKCSRFDPRKLFDATGRVIPITELDENESAAIQQFELKAELRAPAGSRKPFKAKIRFSDRASALALLGKACHWYADRREGTVEPDGEPMQKNVVVSFVKPSMSHEDAYRHMITDP
jgi:hypothetical protein